MWSWKKLSGRCSPRQETGDRWPNWLVPHHWTSLRLIFSISFNEPSISYVSSATVHGHNESSASFLASRNSIHHMVRTPLCNTAVEIRNSILLLRLRRPYDVSNDWHERGFVLHSPWIIIKIVLWVILKPICGCVKSIRESNTGFVLIRSLVSLNTFCRMKNY